MGVKGQTQLLCCLCAEDDEDGYCDLQEMIHSVISPVTITVLLFPCSGAPDSFTLERYLFSDNIKFPFGLISISYLEQMEVCAGVYLSSSVGSHFLSVAIVQQRHRVRASERAAGTSSQPIRPGGGGRGLQPGWAVSRCRGSRWNFPPLTTRSAFSSERQAESRSDLQTHTHRFISHVESNFLQILTLA